MCHQLAFWYKVMGLKIPHTANMMGGVYLWKDGREVPDTMNVTLEHPEEILFSWDSGFGNNQLGSTEDVLGTDGTISKSQQIRYLPQKVNRPDGAEMVGSTRTAPNAHMQNFLDCIRSGAGAELPVRAGLPRLHRLPHGGGELSPAARHALGRRQRRDRLAPFAMDFEYTPEQIQLRKSVREFAEAEIAPHVMEWDEDQIFPAEVIRKLGKLGYMGAIFPEDLGGAGLGYIEYSIIIEELSRVDGSVGIIVAAHTSLCSNHIYKMGSDEQRRRYIPRLASGEWLGCWSLTEPEAGSDAAGTRTSAALENGCWVLERRQDFHHQRALRQRLRGHGGDRPRRRAARHLGLHHRTGHARLPRRQEGKQAGPARQRHRRSDLRELPHPADAVARQARRGLRGQPEGAGWRPHLHRGAGHRHGAGRLRCGAALFQAAAPVQPAHLRISGHPVQAGGYGHRRSTPRACSTTAPPGCWTTASA